MFHQALTFWATNDISVKHFLKHEHMEKNEQTTTCNASRGDAALTSEASFGLVSLWALSI